MEYAWQLFDISTVKFVDEQKVIIFWRDARFLILWKMGHFVSSSAYVFLNVTDFALLKAIERLFNDLISKCDHVGIAT